MRIAAVGDIHMDQSLVGVCTEVFSPLNEKADIFLICGDMTAYGFPEEAKHLVKELECLKIPILGVLGNHDFDHDHQEQIARILTQGKVKILNGEYFIYQDVGFAGIKGFCGGFDNHMLPPFGEDIYKKFAMESVNEALRLETALNGLQEKEIKKKVVLLHYSPLKETVKGEEIEILPFLGSTHLAEPIDSFEVKAAFHGHAHHGSPRGKTSKGIPVFNVSFPLMKKNNPEAPYVIFEV